MTQEQKQALIDLLANIITALYPTMGQEWCGEMDSLINKLKAKPSTIDAMCVCDFPESGEQCTIHKTNKHNKKMTPKDKAKELIAKFYTAGLCNPVRPLTMEDRGRMASAKDCAIVCVEQILPLVPDRPDTPNNFWHQVLTELKSQ